MVLFLFKQLKIYLVLLLFLIVPSQIFGQERHIISLPPAVKVINLAKHNIFEPGLFSVYKGSIAIFDYGSYSLINYKGGKFNIIAEGIGGGPQEFRNPTDLKTNENGNIWVADPEQARISIWNQNGKLLKTFNHGHSLPIGVAPFKDKYIVKNLKYSSKNVFQIYSFSEGLINSFGGLRDSLMSSKFLTGGEIWVDESGYFFTPLYAGYIYKFDLRGNKIYSIKTIQPISVAKVESKEVEIPGLSSAFVTRVSSAAKVASRDLATNKKYLF